MAKSDSPPTDAATPPDAEASPATASGTPAGATEDTGAEEEKPTVENRWWVDAGARKNRGPARSNTTVSNEFGGPIVGERFFAVGRDFDETRAQKNLTNSNLNFIQEANPDEGAWVCLQHGDKASPPERLAKIKRMLRLPKWARGVLIDAGTSIRAIATGSPVGERIVELTIGSQSAFDAWVDGEWVREKTFRNRDRALREGSGLIMRHLKNRGPGL